MNKIFFLRSNVNHFFKLIKHTAANEINRVKGAVFCIVSCWNYIDIKIKLAKRAGQANFVQNIKKKLSIVLYCHKRKALFTEEFIISRQLIILLEMNFFSSLKKLEM